MKQDMKVINFYYRTLEKGCLHGFSFDRDHSLIIQEPYGPAVYVTRMFNTGDPDMTFHRLKMDGYCKNIRLEIIVATSSDLDFSSDNEQVSLERFLAGPEVKAESKRELLMQLPHTRSLDKTDLLLHDLTGQYVWIYLSVLPEPDFECRIHGLRLEFPKYSFSEYFPEIYHGNDFFERYIGIFQSVYMDLEEQVGQLPLRLDVASAPETEIKLFAEWLGLDNVEGLFQIEQIRQMISNLPLCQGGKGTKKALEWILELSLGMKPYIVEYFQWSNHLLSVQNQMLYQKLYGEDSDWFCVILNFTHTPIPNVSEVAIKKMIGQYCVLGAKYKLVFLQKCCHTDTHCYLGVNSYLSVPEVASLNETSLGAFITVG